MVTAVTAAGTKRPASCEEAWLPAAVLQGVDRGHWVVCPAVQLLIQNTTRQGQPGDTTSGLSVSVNSPVCALPTGGGTR